MMNFEVILPFLRPIEHLILDAGISEIMVNGNGRVFVERAGVLEEMPGISVREEVLQIAIKNIARRLGDDIGDGRPILDSRLPDGSRVAAIFPPCSIGGTTLAIRKFSAQLFSVDELVHIGSLTPPALSILRTAIADRKNILISGGTSTGKTTLLNALAALIDPADRLVVIEDTAELHLTQPNVVRLEARRELPGTPAVAIRDLLKATLRLRPDRILLGEVRGAEAFDLMQALNTGHSGTLATIHANSAAQSLRRLSTCILQSDVQLPFQAIQSSIADSINLLLHIERRSGKRIVGELLEVDGYNPQTDRFDLRVCYRATDCG
jgi:pilus assembly protein CpaF